MNLREQSVAITSAFQRRIVPELRYSQTQYEERLREYAADVGRWLDVGCGHQLLPSWRAEAEAELLGTIDHIVGIDYEFDALRRHPNIRDVCRADVGSLPFADASFDLITANMVVEHLAAPGAQFLEIARVLRPGGVFLFHTPNARSYPVQVARLLPDAVKRMLARVLENRASDDVFPTYYRANTEQAIRRTAADAGLAVDALHFIATTPVLGVVPPLALAELVILRQLVRTPALAPYRQTLICALRRPAVV